MLDARQLEALAAVLEEGGFGPAAKALNLTLAAISLRIKGLEAALGQRLLVRGKTVRATPAGQTLLAHVKQLRLMEADLVHGLPGSRAQGGAASPWQSLGVAVNADSLASWFLPGVATTLARYRLLLDIAIHDQDHTLEALKNGDVIGCVSALAQPMPYSSALSNASTAGTKCRGYWGDARPKCWARKASCSASLRSKISAGWASRRCTDTAPARVRHFCSSAGATMAR